MTTQQKYPWALRLGAVAVGGALALGCAAPTHANESAFGQSSGQSSEQSGAAQTEPLGAAAYAEQLPAEPAEQPPAESAEPAEPAEQTEADAAALRLASAPEKSAGAPAQTRADSEGTVPETEQGADPSFESSADPSAEQGAAAKPGVDEPRSSSENMTADFTVTGIQPGAQRFYRESVRDMSVYLASVAAPAGVVYRLEAGDQVTDWHTPGDFARLFFSPVWTGSYYTGEVTLTIRNNSEQVADVFVERRWEANAEGQLRVFPSVNRSELQLRGDVMPVRSEEVFNVGLTITSASGAVRFVRVDTEPDGTYRTTVRGLEPGFYTVQAQTSWRGIPQFDIKGARVLAASEVPSVSLAYEPEMGAVNGWFSRPVGLRVSAEDADGIEWIRVVENGRPYQNVANGSLLRYSTDGRYELVFTARDAQGNESNPRTLLFNLDLTDPTIVRSGVLQAGSVVRGSQAFAEFECADTGSGIESCLISIDGGEPVPSGALIDTRTVRDITYSIIARDAAGREARVEGTLHVTGDTAPPVVTHEASPLPNAHGWNRDEVEVTLDARDAESGLDTFVYRVDRGAWTEPPVLGEPVRVLVTGDDRHLVEWEAVDGIGNSTGVQGRGVNIDSAAPVIAFDPALPDAQIVQGSSVTVSFTCSDALSGVDSCVGSIPNGSALPSDTLGVHFLSVSATDLAGNAATHRISYEVIRADGALAASATPEQPGNRGWWNAPVSVLLDPDPTSGAVGVEWRMTGAQTGNGITDGGEYVEVEAAGRTTIEYAAVDDYGRRGPLQSLDIRIDRVAPSASSVLEPTSNARGWLRRDAVMHIEASDRESGLERVEYRVNGGAWQSQPIAPAQVPITVEGEYAVEYRASDVAGNSTSLRSHAVRLDRTNPVVVIAPSINGAEVEVGDQLLASYDCSDALSGVQNCVSSVPFGQPLPTDSEGDFEFEVTALDNAGNMTRQLAQYTVVAAGGSGGSGGGQQPGSAGGLAATGVGSAGGFIAAAAGASLLAAAGLAFAGVRRTRRDES